MSNRPTLGELLRRIDRARERIAAYDLTNYNAYLKWPEADRIEFDVGKARARMDLDAAQAEYDAAIQQAARAEPDDTGGESHGQ